MEFIDLEFLKNISLIIAICLAIYGIDSWRRSHIGIRQIELAEDTLALFYEASDAVKQIRHPLGYSNETEDITQNENETDNQFEARKNASIVFYRYNKHQELFSKIYASRYRFMSQIGKDKAKPFEDLHKLIMEIIIAARMLSKLWSSPHNHLTPEQAEKHRKKIEKYEAVFWDGLEDEDPINPELDKIITDIEDICQNIISGKGTLHGLLNFKLKK